MSTLSMMRNGYRPGPNGTWTKLVHFPNNTTRMVRNAAGKLIRTEGIYKTKTR